ncbi:cobalamin-binding protein [Thioalkalicoccus limnaeus]|uniref:Cobalamin-binding protein n=1 Tax=Thioalkalicoccus limnaeus TaxID=120681 RepID=A0ABV4BBG2_9GAMM
MSRSPSGLRNGGSFLLLVALLLAPMARSATSPLTVTDDLDRIVTLSTPAERIVSLAPHVTENLFEIGVGERIVGTVSFSDHPPSALSIPRIGGYHQLDLERIIALRPDLVVAWHSGNPRAQTERLEHLGLTLYYSEPRALEDLASSLERLAVLAGRPEQGRVRAQEVRAGFDRLRERHAARPPVRVFYQVWDEPLMSVNETHLIDAVIRLCGGRNIVGHLESLAPRLDLEAVLAADPEVIVSGGMGEDRPDWLNDWRRWTGLTAVRRDNLFFIAPSLLQRPTPRILLGAQQVCDHLETARARRAEDSW